MAGAGARSLTSDGNQGCSLSTPSTAARSPPNTATLPSGRSRYLLPQLLPGSDHSAVYIFERKTGAPLDALRHAQQAFVIQDSIYAQLCGQLWPCSHIFERKTGAPLDALRHAQQDSTHDEVIAQRNIVQKLFIQTAMDLKHENAAIHLPTTVGQDAHNVLFRRHQQWWSLHPWLTSTVHDEILPHKDFPPPNLMEELVDLYFKHMNCYMPLLHRPSFGQGIMEGLHLHDEGFRTLYPGWTTRPHPRSTSYKLSM
ncbi:hypothetical protein GY45DRAFT_1401666 [Cubamyces sp. BRFM 1775]|nr:hypothetical protein GY45DRAFT_1401666 [Cubamyces sp. BRFM 1775]